MEMDLLMRLDMARKILIRHLSKFNSLMGKKILNSMELASSPLLVVWFIQDACSMMDQFINGAPAATTSISVKILKIRKNTFKNLFANFLQESHLEPILNKFQTRIKVSQEEESHIKIMVKIFQALTSLIFKWVNNSQ